MTEADRRELREVAKWTHRWMVAAVLIARQIEGLWQDDDPVGSIESRDALSLALIDAVHNVYRGSRFVLDQDAPTLLEFERQFPDLTDIRNRLEHFDDYARGVGNGQKHNKSGGVGALFVARSSGVGDGHTITISSTDDRSRDERSFTSASAVRAAQQLTTAALGTADLSGDKHQRTCLFCSPAVPKGFCGSEDAGPVGRSDTGR